MANTDLYGWKAMIDALIATGTIKCLLVETGCTPLETHAALSTLLATGGGELDATAGYARQTLANVATAVASGKAKLSSDAIAFTNVNSGDLAIQAVIYWDPGTGDANCIPLCFPDITDEQFTAGNLKTITINCPATGWMNVGNS